MRRKTKDDECKDGSSLKKNTDDKIIKIEGEDKIKTSNMIKSTNILRLEQGEARVGRVGPGRRDRICDGCEDTLKQRYEVSKKEAGDGRVEHPVSGCCFGEELEGDRPHDLGAVEDDSLQE